MHNICMYVAIYLCIHEVETDIMDIFCIATPFSSKILFYVHGRFLKYL